MSRRAQTPPTPEGEPENGTNGVTDAEAAVDLIAKEAKEARGRIAADATVAANTVEQDAALAARNLADAASSLSKTINKASRRSWWGVAIGLLAIAGVLMTLHFRYLSRQSVCRHDQELRAAVDSKFDRLGAMIVPDTEDPAVTPERLEFYRAVIENLPEQDCSDIRWLG